MIEVTRHIALLITLLLSSLSGYTQSYNTQVEAKLDLESNGEFIEITGSAYNKTELNQSLSYLLRVIKNNSTDPSSSKNEQSGRIVLNPGQKRNVSQTTINADDTDRIIILLLLYDLNNTIIGTDRIVINGTEEDKRMAEKNNQKVYVSPDATHEKADGIVLRGIVVEDTKTKPGRDFYQLFYSEYMNNNINGEKIVTIKETLAIANNTKIEVDVGGVKILEFILRPQMDYLKAFSKEAIRRVNKYFINLREGKYIVKHY